MSIYIYLYMHIHIYIVYHEFMDDACASSDNLQTSHHSTALSVSTDHGARGKTGGKKLVLVRLDARNPWMR